MHRWRTGAAAAALLIAGGCYQGADGSGSFGDGLSGADTDAGPGSGGTDTNESGSNSDSEDTSEPVPEDYEPSAVAIRLLLRAQYVESIRTLLGDAAAVAADPPLDTSLNGFTAIGSAQLAIGDSEIDRYESSARAVAEAAVDQQAHADYFSCTPTGATDEACASEFVSTFGRLAFRRPLEAIELEQYTAVAVTAGGDLGEFDDGIEAALGAMLQSPNFLYQVEQGVPDPAGGDHRVLTDVEMATRMSFFIGGTTPDAELLDLAESGALSGEQGVREAALALVESTEARGALANFSRELLRLHELEGLPKDPTAFPAFDEVLAEAMHEETLHLIEHIAFEQDGDFRDVFDADYTFVNDVLASHYGVPGEFGSEFVQVTLPPDQKRGGLLGHAGILSVLSHVSTTSPTLRGKFIRESLLCQNIPAPPPEVVTDLPTGESATMRERLEEHMVNPSCAGCHVLMDPLGFGLESYDGIGAFRTTENGQPIDDSAELEGQPFSGAKELGALLKTDENVAQCLVRNLYRHATGHLETPSEQEELKAVGVAFADSGFRIKNALVEIVASPTFRVVAEPL